jgi:hypothetical protein
MLTRKKMMKSYGCDYYRQSSVSAIVKENVSCDLLIRKMIKN